MAAVINTNIASLNAQRNLGTSQSSLASSLQRLSSGLRINSAKDDAAGLAISERFSTQIRGMNVAARNANDGISLAQSAEGAMTEISNNLQRIRELAVQSRNATNSTSDRAALNAEAQQLKAEVDRVATTTAFNGTKLLDGSFTAQAFQVGANQGETINIAAITNAQSSALGSWNSVSTAAVAGSYTKSTVSGFDFTNAAATAATYTSAAAVSDYSTIPAVASVFTSGAAAVADYSTVAATAANYQSGTVGAYNTGDTFTVQGVGGSAFTFVSAAGGADATALLAEINDGGVNQASLAASGVTVALNGGTLEFTSVAAGAGNVVIGGANASILTAGAPVDTAGAAADTSANATFNIVGEGGTAAITLNSNITNNNDLVAALNAGANGTALTAAGITATNDGANGNIVYTSTVGGATPISFSGAGVAATGSGTGTVTTAGAAADTSANKTFTLQGPGGVAMTVNLTSNITSAADLATAIQGSTGYAGSGMTASSSGANLVLTASTAGAGSVTVGGADAAEVTAGLVTGGNVAGGAANDQRAGFSVDGNVVALSTDVTDQATLVSTIQTQLNASAAGAYTVAASGASGFSITSTTAGITTPATIGTFTGTGSSVFGSGTAVAGAAAAAGAAQTGFGSLDISTAAGADLAMLAMDGALNALNSARADMGAVQNRFSSVVASLQTTSENLSASRSRILDTDFAAETASLTRGQILQQAGTAMLAQANSLPNGVLALLRG